MCHCRNPSSFILVLLAIESSARARYPISSEMHPKASQQEQCHAQSQPIVLYCLSSDVWLRLASLLRDAYRASADELRLAVARYGGALVFSVSPARGPQVRREGAI